MNGWVSPRLGVRFQLTSDNLEIFSPSGERFLTYVELAQLREQECQRADEERQRADEERQRASEATYPTGTGKTALSSYDGTPARTRD